MATLSVTSSVYQAAGAPPLVAAAAGICRTCGTPGTGQPFGEWVRDTFTDWDKLIEGQIICQACQFCFAEQSEVLTSIVAKDKPQRMRNYSHFVAGGIWTPLSKGAKRQMREILASSPDVAVIAESGQKHIIFRAKLGWWQFEEQAIRPFPQELERILAVVEWLYEGGFSKSEIETGRYPQHRILKFGFTAWRALEDAVRPLRGTPRLGLALFLAQKELPGVASNPTSQDTAIPGSRWKGEE